jgi:hypothetical protein
MYTLLYDLHSWSKHDLEETLREARVRQSTSSGRRQVTSRTGYGASATGSLPRQTFPNFPQDQYFLSTSANRQLTAQR